MQALKIWFLALSAALVITTPSSNAASPTAPPGVSDPLILYKQAGANAAQQKQLTGLMKEFDDAHQAKVDRMGRLNLEMRDLSLQPLPDEQTAVQKQQELNTLGNELAIDRIKLSVRMRKILTTAQRNKLAKLMGQRNPK